MSKEKLLLSVISVMLCIALLSVDFFAAATVFTFETQYDHNEADIAWLTDLVIKEDMTTVEGMAQCVTLVPESDYPYAETPESFREDVEYYVSLYNLEAGSQKAGYLYFFEVLNANSELLAGDVSDADIKEYLEGMGIAFPADAGADELIMARALFTAMVTGSLGSSFAVGADLESAVVSYLATITGVNVSSLKGWMPEGSYLSLDEYILAASRMTLWSNGYDVSADTPEDEVYRLIAVMTVKAQGLSVDSDLSFNQLKSKYAAAMLGEKYDVVMDSDKLASHIANGTTAYYILQLMGKNGGLAIREDNATYEEAFRLVAENTKAFDLASDEFYADIFDYSAKLSTRCKSLWICPTAYATNTSYSCTVSVNGVAVRNNYYTEVAIDPTLVNQDLVITVTASAGGVKSVCTYTIRLTQGTYEGIAGDSPVNGNENEEHSYVSADSLVADILASIGVNSVISAVLDKSYSALPAGLSGVVSFIAPTFDDASTTVSGDTDESHNDEFFIAVLDEIGSVVNTEIEGIPGLSLLENIEYGDDSLITFG